MDISPGSFVWCELMTIDPDGANALYEADVGRTIAPGPTTGSAEIEALGGDWIISAINPHDAPFALGGTKGE
ncbi:MAG: hypothetical protein V4579_01305 [Pseudomonadota bacterium]